jgi:L-seryl-tRNA(Ser) seleniumtransferase
MDIANPKRSAALRAIPALDGFVQHEPLLAYPRRLVVRESRRFLAEIREAVLAGRLGADEVEAMFGAAAAPATVAERCAAALALGHRAVFNATGIVLHTGIGRAPLCDAAGAAIDAASRYAVVEVDLVSGERNEREVHVAGLLRELTGAGGALVVNNCAAAMNLVLAALAAGREVLVSRGQLVEIGGGFRMPDVMAQAGCRMVEVGTTNRTHPKDFERALSAHTAMLLRVHPSNFRIVGFTSMPDAAAMRALAERQGALLVEDLGSGLLHDGGLPGLEDEPRVRECLAGGPHLICFSGDKLLGGPQAGIVLGDAALVARVRAHPLYRAFRCDKLILAALEATLRVYRDGDPLAEIPTLRCLAAGAEHLRARAERLAAALRMPDAEVVPSESFAGSGANAARPLPSFAVALPGGDAHARALRSGPGIPVFARLERDRLLLDLRTLELDDLDEVAAQVRANLAGLRRTEPR